MTELHYIRYRHDVKPREHLTKTVKQSIYFYVYISYNKNISYIVTVTLRPGPGAPQEPDGGGRRGLDRGQLVPRGRAGVRRRGVVFIQEISNLILKLVKDQFTKMRKFKSPSQ